MLQFKKKRTAALACVGQGAEWMLRVRVQESNVAALDLPYLKKIQPPLLFTPHFYHRMYWGSWQCWVLSTLTELFHCCFHSYYCRVTERYQGFPLTQVIGQNPAIVLGYALNFRGVYIFFKWKTQTSLMSLQPHQFSELTLNMPRTLEVLAT